MYYYYYYYFDQTKKVTIDIKFNAEDPKSVSFEEFTDFLIAINQLHKRVIFLTQPEYKNNRFLENFDDISLLSYHQLEIVNVHRENPFLLKLTFNLLQSHSVLYWTLWKMLIKICKRYGANSKELKKTIESMRIFFEKLYRTYNILEARDNTFNELFGEPLELGTKDEIFNELKKNLKHFLQNKKTIEIYDSFCKYAITITECFSSIDDFDERIDLLND